jgi:hypothetical protein
LGHMKIRIPFSRCWIGTEAGADEGDDFALVDISGKLRALGRDDDQPPANDRQTR